MRLGVRLAMTCCKIKRKSSTHKSALCSRRLAFLYRRTFATIASKCSISTLCLLLLRATSATLASLTAPQVRLSNGDTIKGSACSQTDVVRFLGIPYAQPPTASLRFMPPNALERSLNQNGSTFDASTPAAPCLQFATEFIDTDPTPLEDW